MFNQHELEIKENSRVFKMSFASVYPHYVQKAQKKGRANNELGTMNCWLTEYN